MLRFTGQTEEGDTINFRFNDFRHIVKDDDLLILDKLGDVIVKFSTVEVEKYEKEIKSSNFPPEVSPGY
jgi:hypothetical protein